MIAIEAKTGTLLWRYKRPLPEDLVNLHPTSRGVGLYGDKVYFASADTTLVALDAKTGKEAWTAKVADYRKGYYTSIMPLVADGKVTNYFLTTFGRRDREVVCSREEVGPTLGSPLRARCCTRRRGTGPARARGSSRPRTRSVAARSRR